MTVPQSCPNLKTRHLTDTHLKVDLTLRRHLVCAKIHNTSKLSHSMERSMTWPKTTDPFPPAAASCVPSGVHTRLVRLPLCGLIRPIDPLIHRSTRVGTWGWGGSRSSLQGQSSLEHACVSHQV